MILFHNIFCNKPSISNGISKLYLKYNNNNIEGLEKIDGIYVILCHIYKYNKIVKYFAHWCFKSSDDILKKLYYDCVKPLKVILHMKPYLPQLQLQC